MPGSQFEQRGCTPAHLAQEVSVLLGTQYAQLQLLETKTMPQATQEQLWCVWVHS